MGRQVPGARLLYKYRFFSCVPKCSLVDKSQLILDSVYIASRMLLLVEMHFRQTSHLKPIFHLANLFVRRDKKVGTLPTLSRRIFSPFILNQSRCRILVFGSHHAIKVAKWKIALKRLLEMITSFTIVTCGNTEYK